MTLRQQWIWRLLSCLFLLSTPALANEVDGVPFPPTPFMFPRGFEWVPVVFVILFATVNGFFLWRGWKLTSRHAFAVTTRHGIGVAVLTLIMIPQIYWWYKRDHHWGGRPFYGWDWAASSSDFISINLLTMALVVLASCYLLYHRPERDKPGVPVKILATFSILLLYCSILTYGVEIFLDVHDNVPLLVFAFVVLIVTISTLIHPENIRNAVILIGTNALIYVTCVIPYVITGAFMHGSIPFQQCSHQLPNGISQALVEYAHDHNGHLPAGHTIYDVYSQLYPKYTTYMELWNYSRPDAPLICPGGKWLDRHPHPYTWNVALSGKTIAQLKALPGPVKK